MSYLTGMKQPKGRPYRVPPKKGGGRILLRGKQSPWAPPLQQGGRGEGDVKPSLSGEAEAFNKERRRKRREREKRENRGPVNTANSNDGAGGRNTQHGMYPA